MAGSPFDDRPSASPRELGDGELLVCALEVAARLGDPSPLVIKHARGTRFDVNRAVGSGKVFDDTPSCVFAMQGNFRWNHSRPAQSGRELTEQDISYRYLTVVLDARTGKLMDLGASGQKPDLTALGGVISDRPAKPGGHARGPLD
ncbi:MAG TPA: hypothetical protein VHU61_16175 [Solirubrobacteraceae bacterium]|jgi:hypothetical protein|nr:hypothetical protein [Solirubrobacteraceae bacterium]